MKKLLLFTALVSLTFSAYGQVELLTNGSFEDGVLGAWTIAEAGSTNGAPGSCVENWRVQGDSVDICGFVTDLFPTDGSFAAFTSFDGNELNTEWILQQEVTIPSTVVAATFSFDFAANFDFTLGAPITIPRELRIELYTTGDALIAALWTDTFIDPVGLSEAYSESLDVTTALSGVEGDNVVVRISAIIPEVATGPSKARIDNVSFIVDDGLNVDEFGLSAGLSVSPNPSNGTVNLNYEGRESLQMATVYDLTGKQLGQYNLQNQLGVQTLNLNLPTGIYMLKVDSDKSSTTRKLIIQ